MGGSKGSGVCSEESGDKTGITGPDSEESGVGGVSGLPGTQPTDEPPNIEDEFDKE